MRTALRSLLRTPAFTLAAVLTIAMGIGVNMAVFTVIHQVLLDPLPFRAPERLVHLGQTHPDFPAMQVTAPDFADWQRQTRSFEGLAAYTFQAMNKWNIRHGSGERSEVQVVQCSASLFPLLGARPLLGRFYTADEERQSAPVVVIHESLWRGKFNADPAIIGRKVELVSWPVTVVGVIRAGEAQPMWGEVWMGLGFLDKALVESRRFHALEVIGRLKPGVTIAQAQAELSGVARVLAREHPEMNGRFGASVSPLGGWITADASPALWIAGAAVALVWLLACANVAHLILVRTLDRNSEFAVRAALGASTARLAKLVLLENLIIALAGGALGALLASFTLPLLLRLAPEIPRLQSTALSPTAFACGLAATLFCSALVAVPSLLRLRQADLHQATKPRPARFGSLVIAAEVALALAVVSTAALLCRSFLNLMNEDPGFRSANVTAMDWSVLAPTWAESQKLYRQQVEPALRALPGVTNVTAVNTPPLALRRSETTRFATRFGIVGQPLDRAAAPVAQARWTTPSYFATLGIPLTRGRLFTEQDWTQPGYVVNEAFVRRYFPQRDPVGQQLLIGVNTPNPQQVPIIGVVADVRDLALDLAPLPTIYSLNVSTRMTILIEGSVNARDLQSALRAATPDAMLQLRGPLDTLRAQSVALRRFALELLMAFAGLAAVLTVIGVYGVVSYTLRLRAREFAIRFALGAESVEVRRVLARHYLIPALAGLAGGVWLAITAAMALRSQLYQLAPADPLTLGVSGFMLLLLLSVAAWRPAAQAAAISPASLLRQ